MAMTVEQANALHTSAEVLISAAELAASMFLPGSGAVVALIDKGVRGILAAIEANTHDFTVEERDVASATSRAILARLEGVPVPAPPEA